MLPKPSLGFALSSIHDSTKLDCRLYHPGSLNDPNPSSVHPWRGHVAIVAHPYAPLGGCFDDPVVDVVAGTLLQLGFLVATFNFRGVSSSGGRTSWTSKPECADYMSVVGFLAYYAYYLDPPRKTVLSPIVNGNSIPKFLFAGYSYGAMITIKLPSIERILSIFSSPSLHTAAADIRLRAQHLAEQQNAMFATPASPRKSLGMRVGGEEDVRRKSHDRSDLHPRVVEENTRKGVKEILARTKLVRTKQHVKDHELGSSKEVDHPEHCLEQVEGFVKFRSAYLIVSPPLGLLTNLATMSFPLTGWLRRPSDSRLSRHEQDDHKAEEDAKLIRCATLVVYGNRDSFSSLRKMRDWTTRLTREAKSRFCYVEIPGAGHFWDEEDVMYRLRNVVSSFAIELLSDSRSLDQVVNESSL